MDDKPASLLVVPLGKALNGAQLFSINFNSSHVATNVPYCNISSSIHFKFLTTWCMHENLNIKSNKFLNLAKLLGKETITFTGAQNLGL